MNSELNQAIDRLRKTIPAVFVGRLCPMHLGHERVLDEMIKYHGIEMSLVMIGSANEEMSLRHFFTYSERKGLIRRLPKFANLKIIPLPDYPTNEEWMEAMDDLLKSIGIDPLRVVFYGGCEEDVDLFSKAGRKVKIVNRFDGSSPKVSATEVRDALIHGRPLSGLVNLRLMKPLIALFGKKWEKFKRM